MWSLFITALGLLFVFEGILPFVAPNLWRNGMQQMMMQSDRTLRIMGLVSMLLGLLFVTLARDLF